jgi:predicted transcriptional regulator of viral defense system
MTKNQASDVFRQWDKRGRYVFARKALAKFFPQDNPKAFTESLQRLVKAGLLVRACRGVYVNPYAHSFDSRVIERIAQALRPGEYTYISLESMLSEYGEISQIPVDRVTLMTTGRKGLYKTPYGVIEFTHTDRAVSDILTHINQVDGRPLRLADKATAWRDLKRVGRNTIMVNRETVGNE